MYNLPCRFPIQIPHESLFISKQLSITYVLFIFHIHGLCSIFLMQQQITSRLPMCYISPRVHFTLYVLKKGVPWNIVVDLDRPHFFRYTWLLWGVTCPLFPSGPCCYSCLFYFSNFFASFCVASPFVLMHALFSRSQTS